EGPAVSSLSDAPVTTSNPQGEAGINLSNGKLKVSLWGKCDQLTLSVAKTDVYDRSSGSVGLTGSSKEGHSPRPVGRLLLMASDFAGAAQPQVSTAIHNGVNSFTLTRGTKTAELACISTRSETNVLAIQANYSGLSQPVFARILGFPHKGAQKPQAGNDGSYFWLRQILPADKTFPGGLDYYFVGKVGGTNFKLQNVQGGNKTGKSAYERDAGP